MDERTMLRYHAMYQKSWTGWKCDHQSTPRLSGLPKVTTRLRITKSASSPSTVRKIASGPVASSTNAKVERALVTLDPLSYRRTKRNERQKPWNERAPKSSPRYDWLELRYEAYLPRERALTYRAREYVTNTRYGQLYEICREESPKPAPKENRVGWLWEKQFQLWQLDLAWRNSSKQISNKGTDNSVRQPRVKDVAGRHVTIRNSNSVSSDAKPHADLFAVYHNQLLISQRRQTAAIVIQRQFRGWHTRMRLARLKRRVLLELGRPWSKVLEEYRELVSRVQARHGVMRTGFRFSLSDMEEYVDRRQRYERAFENMAADGKLSSDRLEQFLKECGHYPTKRELNKAFSCVFKGSGSTAELVFVLDCSTSVGVVSFLDQMIFVKDVVRSLHVAPHRVRVGVVPYNTDVFQTFGLLQHSSGQEVIEAVDKIRFQPGLTLTDKGLRIMRDIFKDARPGVQKVAVVITDGQSDDKKKTALEAKRARQENITIFAIGVGHDVDREELQDIAGDVSRVSLCSDYRSLLQLKHLVSSKLCLPACVLCQTILPRVQLHGLYKSEALEILYTLHAPPATIASPRALDLDVLSLGLGHVTDDKPGPLAPSACCDLSRSGSAAPTSTLLAPDACKAPLCTTKEERTRDDVTGDETLGGGRAKASESSIGVRERIHNRDVRNAQQGNDVTDPGNERTRNASRQRTELDKNEKGFHDDIISSLASLSDKTVGIGRTAEAASGSARWTSSACDVRDDKEKTDNSCDAWEDEEICLDSPFWPSRGHNSRADSRGCTPVAANVAAEIVWTIYPPRAAHLPPRQSRWIRPLVDGEEAWPLLDDSIIKATDFKVCLGLVIKAKLEREGAVTLPSDVKAGVETVTSYEEAMRKIEQHIEKRKREGKPPPP